VTISINASIVNEDYKKLKEDTHKKINKEINDNYLLTALKYLNDAGYLYEKIKVKLHQTPQNTRLHLKA
jgi:predicted transcriptional regulator